MTTPEDKNTDPANINTELAKERTYAAYERTFLAWIRTALALVGFGIGIFEYAESTGGTTILKSSKLVGLALIFMGAAAVLFAMLDVKKNTGQLTDPEFRYHRKSTLGIKMGYVFLAICLFALIRGIYRMITMGI